MCAPFCNLIRDNRDRCILTRGSRRESCTGRSRYADARNQLAGSSVRNMQGQGVPGAWSIAGLRRQHPITQRLTGAAHKWRRPCMTSATWLQNPCSLAGCWGVEPSYMVGTPCKGCTVLRQRQPSHATAQCGDAGTVLESCPGELMSMRALERSPERGATALRHMILRIINRH